jgi:DnaJ-class molecular chaperone
MAKKNATSATVISEYEAAALTGMSPTLLRWLTKHAPKSGISRKLKIDHESNGCLYFDRQEVLEFDAWLKAPWPSKDGKRPHVPKGIRSEIKVEANGACAICLGHKDTCEAAHLDPVQLSKNNHPDNLLWLCANDHTAFDGGLFGPTEENATFVKAQKEVLRRFRIMQFRMQAELTVKVLSALETCERLHKQLNAARTEKQVKAAEGLAKTILAKLPTIAPVSKADAKFAEFEAISFEINKLARSGKSVRSRLGRVGALRRRVVEALDLVACPLCDATGRHHGEDCPVCLGDRELESGEAERVEVDRYDSVDCPVCEGSGRLRGEDCPACGGEGDMERRFAERIDERDYTMVECPICEGACTHLGLTCHACGGEGQLERRHADVIDTRDYELVECPLCEGTGRHEDGDCAECGGGGTMQRRHADRVDLREYGLVDCPVCEGSGRLRGEDCPACGAEGRFERRHLDRVDPREYALVSCPRCRNRDSHRDECRACGGHGEIERRHADQID